MKSEKIKGDGFTHLYFPLANLGKNASIFADREKGILAEKYKPVMMSIIGKQLALNTYYANDLIATANTRITMALLKTFDQLKINFKVNLEDITDAERNTAMDLAMGEIIRTKREFLESIKRQDIPGIQTSVNRFISESISRHRLDAFSDHYDRIKAYLDMANSVITSQENYVATAAAIKRVIDSEQRIFNLPSDHIGETVEHVVKTTQLSLLLAGELEAFSEADCRTLSIIALGHDGGKALVPESIIYKKGRLTQLENDIMKSHVLLSFVLASNNQENLDIESFSMALHHVKENKDLPQSYGIARGTHTSFYDYLTPDAQARLNELYHGTKKYYRVIGIADTFEAITADRVYKRASSIGKALEIMVAGNKKHKLFYQPYLDVFIRFILNRYLPKNMAFKLSDDIMDAHFKDITGADRQGFQSSHQGVVVATGHTLDTKVSCIIYRTATMTVERKLFLPPALLLQDIFFQ
ncbi:MAG TPA: hypothetical protein DHV36_07420 [Desulfobacteraceae bacterium]|nr:hypothetical protein [Desulfobacteraceae bacterium]